MRYYTRQQHRRRSEATEQETLIAWCGWQQAKHPELKLLYHVPNGGSRNQLEAVNLKRQGVKAGVPDLCLPVPMNGFHGLYIEMKYGKNKTTETQKEWLQELKTQGYATAVCYGAEEAEKIILSYLHFDELSEHEQKIKNGKLDKTQVCKEWFYIEAEEMAEIVKEMRNIAKVLLITANTDGNIKQSMENILKIVNRLERKDSKNKDIVHNFKNM